jgi:hypothetical protein
MISRYSVVKTHILIELIKDNPFHDDTTADEKYQFTCMIDFRPVAIDENLENKINTIYWPVENSIHKNNDADDR